MRFRALGKTDIRISEIGYGCMSLKSGGPDEHRLLQMAFDRGINYFDTADIYSHGLNESLLGKALGKNRQQVIIGTKAGNSWNADGTLSWKPSRAYLLNAAEESLRRLHTDYIDLYQLHGGTLDDPFDEILEAFDLLQQKGMIRYYGISSIRPNLIRQYVERSSLVSVMMQYSLIDRRAEASCLPLLAEKGIAVLARGALAQGLLIGKPAKDYLGQDAGLVEKAKEALRSLSAGRDPAHTALQFVLAQPAIRCAVVGMRTRQQLETALEAASFPALSLTDTALLKKNIPPNFYEQHL
jgi:aryl-alcohol dehydrogenase-like predicted oxidoreductase